MAKVYITEYRDGARTAKGNSFPSMKEPAITSQTLTTSGSSGQTAAFDPKTKFIRVHTDGIMSFVIGANPTATTNSPRMAAGQTEYFAVETGHKLAAITNT